MRPMILIALLTLWYGVLPAQSTSEMTVEVVINADHGWPTRILVSGKSHLPEAWLGISLYPYGVLDPLTGGRHSHITLQKGEFSQEITVDQPLLGGSFEFAIWGKKVDKVDCTLDYCYWCKTYGYHFEDLIVYKSGLLNQMVGY